VKNKVKERKRERKLRINIVQEQCSVQVLNGILNLNI
jgi:hypothetical protein